VPVVMRPDFYFNTICCPQLYVLTMLLDQFVIRRLASATGFLTSFPVQTVEIIFLPILIGDIVARSGLFEEAMCLYGRWDGEEGKQECYQTDQDGHGACRSFACVMP
jgi:hypothetical protein